ncbi:hypothetical protein DI005_36910 [Prauserella sp. PE36]|uniref:LapA family protein n=1 Tax=Prauserella endophytica TaxID=1592324 RepID=A0ABY2RUL9_9PSEU|nr:MULTISPECIES: hypothetical protein [Prauserella]PXY37161.1 hypothetical protein BAY59_00805 [Prauserella coralliicola]RBM10190.1 hypothetical protein DI005_36910 [Prauserella sp. PE36]TKG61068.1 hypothetical protein FCN18_34250 [Prauserella endophytica]
MLWLFGQIWLWLLISFALGAGLTALLFRRPARQRPPERPVPPPAAPPPAEAEETRHLPATGALLPEPSPDHSHQEGTLPPRRAWHVRNEWPDEQDAAASEDQESRRGG